MATTRHEVPHSQQAYSASQTIKDQTHNQLNASHQRTNATAAKGELLLYRTYYNTQINTMSPLATQSQYHSEVSSRHMSAHISRVAHRKASIESSRPKQDLRLLLAHVRILDSLEQQEAELYETQSPTKSKSTTRGPEYERKRPSQPTRRESPPTEKEAFDLLFEYVVPSSEDSPPTSPEESSFEEWYA